MGASPYYYFVDYEEDIQEALNKLRQREFEAGRYFPVAASMDFPVTDSSPSPGPKHDSIEEALNRSGAEGTCSILDLERIADAPYDAESNIDTDELGVVFPASDEFLMDIFGSTQPDALELEELIFDVIEDVERGMGICVVGHRDGKPATILFAGYSYD